MTPRALNRGTEIQKELASGYHALESLKKGDVPLPETRYTNLVGNTVVHIQAWKNYRRAQIEAVTELLDKLQAEFDAL